MPEYLLYSRVIAAAAIVSTVFVWSIVRLLGSGTSQLKFASLLAISLGLLTGYYLLSLGLAWPPVNCLDRLLMIVLPIAIGIELIAGFEFTPRPVAWLLRISLAAAMPRILLHGSVYLTDWTLWQAVLVMTFWCVLLAGLWSLLAWLSGRSPGVTIPLALCLAIQCAAMTVIMAGYLKGGAAGFPLVATLACTAIAAKLITTRSGATSPQLPENVGIGVVGIGVVGLFGLLFMGRFFGRISTADALIMLLAPLLCWASEAPQLRDRKPWLVGSVRLLLVAIPLLVVLAQAKLKFDRDMSPLLSMDIQSAARLPRIE